MKTKAKISKERLRAFAEGAQFQAIRIQLDESDVTLITDAKSVKIHDDIMEIDGVVFVFDYGMPFTEKARKIDVKDATSKCFAESNA